MVNDIAIVFILKLILVSSKAKILVCYSYFSIFLTEIYF